MGPAAWARAPTTPRPREDPDAAGRTLSVSAGSVKRIIVDGVEFYVKFYFLSSLTDVCHLTRLLEMTPSKPSSLKLEVESMSQELSSLTSNPPSSMRPVSEPTVNFTILSN